MRGWIALTSDWKRPVMPAPPEPRVVPIKTGRPPLLSKDERRKLYDMDLLIQETREEMAAIIKKAGLTHEQGVSQMTSIRRRRG